MLVIWNLDIPEQSPFFNVLGLTIAERAVLAAQAAGYKEAAIVATSSIPKLQALFADHSKIKIKVTVHHSMPDLSQTDELSFIQGNQIVTSTAMALLAIPLEETADARILPGINGEPCAIRIKTASLNDNTPLTRSALLKLLQSQELKISAVSKGNYAAYVNSEKDIKPAGTLLLKSLVKDADGVISRNINRKISLFLSRHIARTSIVPNQITAVVFLVGICSGLFAFFMESYYGFLIGAFCYYLSAILDGCDGEISRLKYMGSPMGAWLDTIVDDLVGLSYILGLYGRLALDRQGLWPVIGTGTLAMYLTTILPRYYVMAKTGSGDFQKLAAKKRPREITGFAKVVEKVRSIIFRTDFLPFYAFVTAASGYLTAFAIPFSIGSVASAVDSLIDLVKFKNYQKR
jgi:phosphatidylglycerophosphate synthase